MASRRPEGTALLVAGHGALSSLEASALHTLGQIGEALLATGEAWQIRRLASMGGARYAPDRGALKQHLDELCGEPARAAALVIIGSVAMVGGEPVLITSDRAREYPEDATLPLTWIRDRVRGAKAEQLVVVVSARDEGGAQRLGDGPRRADDGARRVVDDWQRALATDRPTHLIAVAAAHDEHHPIIDALLTALCGDALDGRTGTVTMASLSTYLAGQAGAAVQACDSTETFAQPPPLGGLWDVRRSQLSMRATRPRTPGDSEDLTGSVLPGRFRIDSVLARGTFGTVYRARQLAVERDVAIKVLHADIDPSSEDGRLFVHEIRSVGRLDHANVVRIHQADITHDGRLFFAMELLDGRDLQEVGAAEPLPRARAVELTRQLLAGLGAAHDAGLVHADVKPANALVVVQASSFGAARRGSWSADDDERGVAKRGHASGNGHGSGDALRERVVLVDFGLARLRPADRPAESAGGTPAYMAPEQLHTGRVDARSDLFSAALVLVYLLTGWRRPNAFTLTPPFELIKDPDLRAVLERALELDPARRYATARELSSALTGAALSVPELLPGPAAPFRQLAPFTEADRGRLYGREAELAELTQLALYRRSVIYTAPSGTGKTSMLRAGLVPRLEALGVHAVYLRCRADSTAALAGAIAPDSEGFADATTLRAKELEALALRSRPARDSLASWSSSSASSPSAAVPSSASSAASSSPSSASSASAASSAASSSPSSASSASAASSAASSSTAASSAAAASSPSPSSSSTASSPSSGPDEPVPGRAAMSIAAAIGRWHRQRGGKLVVILDQVEAALGDPDFVREVLGFADWPVDADVAVVLSIREDHLARLLAPAQLVEPGIPLVRLPPLGPDGARAAIIGPITEARLAIEPELLDALLADLQNAARAIGPEMGWGTAPAVFPPHLQLACSVLYEELAPGDATLTLAHYKQLGGFDAIVGEHLERVLDTELTDGSDAIARALFVALVTATHERAMRPESELIAMVGGDAERVQGVLEVLRSRGLLVRVRGEGEPSWELAHDSLVPRVLAWVDARDLDRRRAIELVRYRLRRSRRDAPSLLDRAELRELRPHVAAIAELDAEWQRRGGAEPWTPSRLIARSRQVLRRRTAIFASLLGVAIALASTGFYRSYLDAVRRDAEAALRARNLGRFTLSLEPFDWDPAAQRATAADAATHRLDWRLLRSSNKEPGAPFAEHDDVERGATRFEHGARIDDVEARGGPAFLAVTRPGCAPSVLPLKELPGYAERELARPVLHIRVPTCAASRAGMIEIPAGPFIYGGGVPPSPALAAYPALNKEVRLDLPTFWIDRTEVTNAAFAMLADMAEHTGVAAPIYPRTPELERAGLPRRPVTGVDWFTAQAYCRYLGRTLPTSEQWVKAMRGGLTLPDGTRNPIPNRNYPFGVGDPFAIAALQPETELADVGSHPGDASPYGVLDLTGNAEEWTATVGDQPGIRILRGGGFEPYVRDHLVDFMAVANPRVATQTLFAIGLRCAMD